MPKVWPGEHTVKSTQVLNLLGGQHALEASQHIHKMATFLHSPEGRTYYKIYPREQAFPFQLWINTKTPGLTNFSSDPQCVRRHWPQDVSVELGYNSKCCWGWKWGSWASALRKRGEEEEGNVYMRIQFKSVALWNSWTRQKWICFPSQKG